MSKIALTPPRAVVFDLDGTLVDTAPDIIAALNALLAEQGRPSLHAAAVRQLIGDGAQKLVERGFAATGGPAPQALAGLSRRFLELYEPRIARLSRPYPGVRDTLARLAGAGFRLGVCTNKASRATRRLLDDLALSQYFAAVAGGDGPARKPDPKHLLAVLDALGAAPETALMVGDSANDVHAARAAGVRVAVVSFGYTTVPAAELGADALIDRFEQLAALVGL